MNRIYRRIGHEVAAEGGRSPDAIEEFYSAIDFVCEYKPDERMVFETEMRERQRRRAMYDMIVTLSTYEECCDFFDDLCTGKELEALEQRFEVAKMLSQDKVYLDIMKSTGASSATISRVKRMLSDGTGCLREKMIRSLEEDK